MNYRKTMRVSLRAAGIVCAGLTLTVSSAVAATRYVAPLTTDCTPSVPGSGTLADPWTNLFYAMTQGTLLPGDVLQLRGGTYRNAYAGFTNPCQIAGLKGTVLPLNRAGTQANPIVIENYAGEIVIIDGTDADMDTAAWTACGTNAWQTTAFNVGNARTPQIWVNPSGPDVPGSRLRYRADLLVCSGLQPGEFSVATGGLTIYLRLSDNSDANLADIHMSCQGGDCAAYPIHAVAAANWLTIRRNPSGGSFYVKYGYYGAFIEGDANNLTLDGLQFVAHGGRDYGSCLRLVNGDFITFRNGVCRETMGEGLQLYGGGPGGSLPGIQITNNAIENSLVEYTGAAWVDGGDLGQNNLGMGIIVKNCSDCIVRNNIVRTVFALGISVTSSTDVGESNNVIVEGNTLSDVGYINTLAGTRTRACISYQPQRSATNGAVRNGIIRNNTCQNVTFGSGTTWPASMGPSSAAVYGISLSDAGNTAMTGIVMVNNSFDNLGGPALNLLEVNQPVTVRNNALGGNLSTAGNTCNGGGACDYMAANGVAHIHTNNTYWGATSTTQVIRINGGASYTRAQATTFEVTAVQADPQFVSSTDLKLQSTSALIDAGTNINCPPVDHDGTARPQGAQCDVGAFEFIGGGPGPGPCCRRLTLLGAG